MSRQLIERSRPKARKAARPKPPPRPPLLKGGARGVNQQEEEILRKATLELITKHGGLFVATALRETTIKSVRVWIITVTLRYPTGFEGYVGDLLYDGDTFTFLTEPSIIDERVRQIAADPEGIRQWNEHRTSTSRPRKA